MDTYNLSFPDVAIDAILATGYELQNAGYIFRGVASEQIGTPSERSWVLAGEGETGHGFTTAIPKGYIGVCVFDGTSWTGKLVKCVSIDSTPTPGSTNAVSSGGAYAALNQLATGVAEALDNMQFTDVTPPADEYTQLKLKLATTDSGIERIITYLTFLSATTSKAGLLSAADKQKLDAILNILRSLEIDDTTAYADLGDKIVESLKATIGGTEETISTFQILAATASKAGLLSASDKAKLDAILGNLRSLEIDDTTAYADLGDKIVESLKATIGGTEETISTFQLLAATASKAGLLSAADKAKLDALWSSGYQFVGIATPSTTPVSTTSKIFYIATEAGTYFNAVTITQGINILSWDGSAWSAVQVIGIDDTPVEESENLVKSGGVDKYAKSAVSLANTFFDTVPLAQGSLDAETGLPVDSTVRVATKYYIPTRTYLKVKSGYVIYAMYKYQPDEETDSFEFVSRTGYSGVNQLILCDEGYVYRFIFAKSDATDTISPDDDIIDTLYCQVPSNIKTVFGDYKIKMANVSNGRYWDLSGNTVASSPIEHTGDNYRCCDEIPVNAGDVFLLTTKGASNARAYALTDTSRSILIKADANAYIIGQTITAAQNGFLFVNCANELYDLFLLRRQCGIGALETKIKSVEEHAEEHADALFDYKSYNLKTGAYWLTSGTTVTDTPRENASYAYSNEIPVKKGDVFLLTTKGASNARAYALTDIDKTIVEVADANVTLTDYEITVDEDGYLYANCPVANMGIFSLQKKSFEGDIDRKLNGDYKLLTPIETIPDSLFDYKGDVRTANGYEIKVFSTRKDCVYRIKTNVASSATKDERAFAFMWNDSVKVGPVPLGLPIYDINGDFTVKCDGSWNQLYVYGLTDVYDLTGNPKVLEKELPIFESVPTDINGISLTDDKPLDMIQGASLVAMIKNWGFIGDSFVSGCFEYKVNSVTNYTNNNYDVSPPQIMMRINGCDGWNFSMGGCTAKQWCGGLAGHVQDADREWVENGSCKVKSDLKQAYYIQLGSNDAVSGGITIGDLDTDVDPTDYHNNADTFAGWYAGVIQRVLSVNPKAYFIISTLRLTHAITRRMAASDVIRAIPKFFKDNGITDRIFVVDQEKYGLDWNAPCNAPYYNGGHPTALGQYYIATWINTYINDVIRNNMLAFNEVQFVGTDKQYNDWDYPQSVDDSE